MSGARAFTSVLGPTIDSYLALKKALGRGFARETAVLAHLDRFLVARAAGTGALDGESFETWSLTLAHLKPTDRRNRMRIVRNLCLYLQRSNPGCFVPDVSRFPAPHAPEPPHIFTEQQIIGLFRVAACLRPNSNSPLCPEVFRLAIVLLYTAGLRRGELVRLIISDYNPIECTLLVRSSKFHKSRLVALSADATREMELYLRARRRLPCDPGSPLLVNHHNGLHAYSGAGIGGSLHSLFGRADIRTVQGRIPRVHDLRHTHAVHNLLRWYRAGEDVQAKLPVLATAMGHVSIASTAYYLRFLEPVAQAASDRFARQCMATLAAFSGEGGGR